MTSSSRIIYRIKQFASDHRRLLIYQGILFLAYLTMLVSFDYGIGYFHGNGGQLVEITTNCIVLSLPTLFLRGRWRVINPVVLSLIAVFYIANSVYFRFWNNLIPFDLIFKGSSYNGFVFTSGLRMLRLSDLIYLLAAIAGIVFYLALKISKAKSLSWKATWWAVGIGAVIFAGGTVVRAYSGCRYWTRLGVERPLSESIAGKITPTIINDRVLTYGSNELILYCYLSAISQPASKPVTLSEHQKKEISGFLRRHRQIAAAAGSDTTFASNSRKNLILIVVESLNADIIGKKALGRSLTPTLDSLLNQEGTISCLRVLPQIADGTSSDGQFMYNTGILPLVSYPVALGFAENEYPSLAEAMGYGSSVEIIKEPAALWNHQITSKSYHYDRLIDNLNPGEKTFDQCVFDRGVQEMQKLPQPFMAEMTTLTMHHPFNDPAAEKLSRHVSGDPLTDRFMAAVSAFDTALNKLITDLKDHGLYDNSVIVLVSDHDIAASSNPGEGRHDIAFIALNTGVTRKIEHRVGQIDVYPTILQIMNRKNYPWQGVGFSILDERNVSAADAQGEISGEPSPLLDPMKKDAWKVSELIITGNYFKK